MKAEEKEILTLILRSVYMKGLIDGNKQTADMSWEDKTITAVAELFGGRK